MNGSGVSEVERGGLRGRAEEGGESERGSSRWVEDVLAEVLVIDAQDDGGSLGGCWVEETLTPSRRTCSETHDSCRDQQINKTHTHTHTHTTHKQLMHKAPHTVSIDVR